MTTPNDFVVNGGYITLPIVTDPSTLQKNALVDIGTQLPGWVPQEGHIEVLMLEEFAAMAAESANVAVQVPQAIFQYAGTALFKIPPITGAYAFCETTWTMVDTQGYTIPAGTVAGFSVLGNQLHLFTTATTFTVATGNLTASNVQMNAMNIGAVENGHAAGTMVLVTGMSYVASVVSTSVSTGGADAETAAAYMDRLSAELQLLAPRPILAADYALMAPNVPGVYRALAIDGLNPGRTITDGQVASGGHVLTSPTQGQFTSADVGRTIAVTGSSITGSAVVTGYTTTTLTIGGTFGTTIASGATAVLQDLTGQQRYVAVCGIDVNGNALSNTIATDLQGYLSSYREVNFVVASLSPTVTDIDVEVTVYVDHGYNTSAVGAAVSAALYTPGSGSTPPGGFLSPATWGGGNNTPPTWSASSNTVRYLDIANVINSVPGVAYISTGTLNTRVHGGTWGTADITLSGDAPLPSVVTGSITVTTIGL